MSAESDAADGSVGAVEYQIAHPGPPYTSADDEKPSTSKPDLQTGSVEVPIALYTSGIHMEMLKSPSLDTKYLWSSPVLSGRALYVEYRRRSLTQRLFEHQHEQLDEYTSVLKNLKDNSVGGYQKGWSQHHALAKTPTQFADWNCVNQFDITGLQTAVTKGCVAMEAIEEKFGDSPSTTNVRGLADAAMAACIAFDTFSGSKMEWVRPSSVYDMAVLDSNGDRVICPEHKTPMTYGGITKLPYDGGISLVPATQGARTVYSPSVLNIFRLLYRPADARVCPTSSLQRKLFNRAATSNAMNNHNKTDDKDKKEKTENKVKKEKKKKKQKEERPHLMIADVQTDGEGTDEYAYVKSACSRKTEVDPCAHACMRSAVGAWPTRNASRTVI